MPSSGLTYGLDLWSLARWSAWWCQATRFLFRPALRLDKGQYKWHALIILFLWWTHLITCLTAIGYTKNQLARICLAKRCMLPLELNEDILAWTREHQGKQVLVEGKMFAVLLDWTSLPLTFFNDSHYIFVSFHPPSGSWFHQNSWKACQAEK